MNLFSDGVPAVGAAEVPDGAYLLDVREPDEWGAGHAPEAVHIPLGELAVRAAEVPNDRDVYIICRSGARSAQAVIALNDAGWRTTNVRGGMHAWHAEGRPMVTDSGLEPYVG